MFIYRFYIGHGPRAMVCSKKSNNIKKRYEPIDGICGDDEIDIHSTFQSRAIIEFHIKHIHFDYKKLFPHNKETKKQDKKY